MIEFEIENERKIDGGEAVGMELLRVEDRDKKVQEEKSISWVFSNKPVTAWGGLRLIKEMWLRMGWRQIIRASGIPEPQSNRGYDPVVMMETFMVCVWIGGARFAHTQILRYDQALKEIFGWKEVASTSTFTRFFRRFKRSSVDNIFGSIQRWFWDQIPAKTLTLDLDSSVMTRYGNQQGATKAYNPRKPGRKSHHPLFAFVADVRMVLHAWLRSGNANDTNGVIEFFRESLLILGQRHRVGLVRADSGFFYGAFMKFLESEGIHYILAARLNAIIRSQIVGLDYWVSVDTGLAVSEMKYQAQGWEKERRVIVVRQQEALRPEAKGKLLLEIPGYRYQVYVTDLDLAALEIWRLYRPRADSENRIEELKYDFGCSGFCLESFDATEAAFRTILLSYNLMSLFRQALLQAPKAIKLSTMKFQCFALGASLGRSGREKVLRISLGVKRRAWFEGLFARIEDFHSPWPLKT